MNTKIRKKKEKEEIRKESLKIAEENYTSKKERKKGNSFRNQTVFIKQNRSYTKQVLRYENFTWKWIHKTIQQQQRPEEILEDKILKI